MLCSYLSVHAVIHARCCSSLASARSSAVCVTCCELQCLQVWYSLLTFSPTNTLQGHHFLNSHHFNIRQQQGELFVCEDVLIAVVHAVILIQIALQPYGIAPSSYYSLLRHHHACICCTQLCHMCKLLQVPYWAACSWAAQPTCHNVSTCSPALTFDLASHAQHHLHTCSPPPSVRSRPPQPPQPPKAPSLQDPPYPPNPPYPPGPRTRAPPVPSILAPTLAPRQTNTSYPPPPVSSVGMLNERCVKQ